MRTTFGILISHDAGGTWSWLCEDAIALPPTASEDPSLAVTASDTIIAGIYKGLEVSPDTGCNWGFAGGALAKQIIADVAVRPDAPHTTVALASTYGADAGADGGAGYATQVYESTDDGATWSPLGATIPSDVVVTTVDVAGADPHRLYVSGFRASNTSAPNTALLYVSVDDGAHWTERALPPLMNEVAAYIAAIDPTNADIVYLRTAGDPQAQAPSPSRLFVTTDAGQSFVIPLVLGEAGGQMLGFALSPDGTKVYAGSPQAGLFVATRAALSSPNPFRNVSPLHVQCLAARGSELWACSDESSMPVGFVAGVSTDDGATFTAKLHLDGIASALACEADATAAQCSGAPFEQLCENFGGCAGWDGGPPGTTDAGDAGVTSPPPTTHPSCGCDVPGGGAGAAAVGAAAALGAIAARRRRR
jgi:MYXO-CTERM domain-containing protein